jgi:stress-induced morphogen
MNEVTKAILTTQLKVAEQQFKDMSWVMQEELVSDVLMEQLAQILMRVFKLQLYLKEA